MNLYNTIIRFLYNIHFEADVLNIEKNPNSELAGYPIVT